MRIARMPGLLRRGKALAVVAVLAPAVLMLAMGTLALLRPAAPRAAIQMTPSVTISQPLPKTSTATPTRHVPTVLPGGRNATKTPRAGGGGRGPRGGPGPH